MEKTPNATATLRKCIKIYTNSRISPVSYIVSSKPVSVNDPDIRGYQLFELIKVEHPFGDPLYKEKSFSSIVKTGKVLGLRYDGNVVTLVKPE